MHSMNLLIIPLAVAATILTYAASYRMLKEFTAFGPPRLIAAIVALLSGLGLLSLGGGVVAFLLLRYAALGLSLLLLPLLKWPGSPWGLARHSTFLRGQHPFATPTSAGLHAATETRAGPHLRATSWNPENGGITMRWTPNLTDRWADCLRFAIKSAFILNGVMVAGFSVWFVAMFLWRLHQLLARAWFGHSW